MVIGKDKALRLSIIVGGLLNFGFQDVGVLLRVKCLSRHENFKVQTWTEGIFIGKENMVLIEVLRFPKLTMKLF